MYCLKWSLYSVRLSNLSISLTLVYGTWLSDRAWSYWYSRTNFSALSWRLCSNHWHVLRQWNKVKKTCFSYLKRLYILFKDGLNFVSHILGNFNSIGLLNRKSYPVIKCPLIGLKRPFIILSFIRQDLYRVTSFKWRAFFLKISHFAKWEFVGFDGWWRGTAWHCTAWYRAVPPRDSSKQKSKF